MKKEDSAKFWFPKITLASHWLATWLPKTVLIDYDEEALAPSLMGQYSKEYERLYYVVERAASEFDGPVFIRTDLTSAKHSGIDAYKVSKYDALNHALLTTLSHAQLKSYHSKIKSSAIMVRQWINVKHDRTAFNGLPIGNEWRVFADNRDVRCVHRYWPKEALEGHMDDKMPTSAKEWSQLWIRTDLLDDAVQAAKAATPEWPGEQWSVDFVEDVNGKFWLIDMATAENSYHAPCVNKT